SERAPRPVPPSLKEKVALFCDVQPEAVISAVNVDSVYGIPLILNEEGLDDIVVDHLQIKAGSADLAKWQKLVSDIDQAKDPVQIAIVGKYVKLRDAYISVVEALRHAGFAHGSRVQVGWVDPDILSPQELGDTLSDVQGILVPGGFGVRGIEGKIKAIEYARKNNVPFLGICLGLQCAVVEYARNVLGLEDANSSEFNPGTPYPVIDLLPDQKDVEDLGGTMRLGAYACQLTKGSRAQSAYGRNEVHERHRHRYEVNNAFREQLFANGLVSSGVSSEQGLVEIVELKDHNFFVASQFHPEFLSRPNRPHPLFRDFVGAARQFDSG
ncbi:MAG: CTP synthase, partial [Terriglobia bacterium]